MAISASKVQVTFPAATPALATLREEAKDQLSLFTDDTFDSYIDRLIVTAVTHAGTYIGQALEPEEVTEHFSKWDNRLILSRRQVDAAPATITYYDENHTAQTINTGYLLDTSAERAAIIFTDVPSHTLSNLVENPISLVYDSTHVVGLDNSAIRQAVHIMVADMFAERETNPEGRITHRAHITAERLLSPYRRYHV